MVSRAYNTHYAIISVVIQQLTCHVLESLNAKLCTFISGCCLPTCSIFHTSEFCFIAPVIAFLYHSKNILGLKQILSLFPVDVNQIFCPCQVPASCTFSPSVRCLSTCHFDYEYHLGIKRWQPLNSTVGICTASQLRIPLLSSFHSLFTLQYGSSSIILFVDIRLVDKYI